MKALMSVVRKASTVLAAVAMVVARQYRVLATIGLHSLLSRRN